MIFFGKRSKVVAGSAVSGIMCPDCQHQQHYTFGVLRYFHLYWIPTFVTSRKVGIECSHCKKLSMDDEIPAELKKEIKSAVFNKKNTLPMFSGIFIIALLFLAGGVYSYQQEKNEQVYISQPAVNDLYIVDFTKLFDGVDPKYKYGLLRVKHRDHGQLGLQVSQLLYNKVSGIRDDIRLKKVFADSYYEEDIIHLNMNKLPELKRGGVIHSVERPN